MLELIPWESEPESTRILVMFNGTRSQFRDGLAAWLRHRGSLDLFGALIRSDAKLPGPSGEELWVLSARALPEYGMLGWWLHRSPQWRVFYQPGSGNDEHVRDGSKLGGCFLPWGCKWAGETLDLKEPILICHGLGRLILPEELANVFEEFDRNEALAFSVGAAPAAIESSHEASKQGSFEMRLADAIERAPSNPRSELDRLRIKIGEMEEHAAMLDWLVRDQIPDIFLWIYPELESDQFAAGTYWALRKWFLEASEQAVAEFAHARVEVEGFGKAFGQKDDYLTLHILKPEQLSRPIRHTPPEPTWKLRLDRSWRREGSTVFVLEGLELRPAPPLRNKHVCDLLRTVLWQDCAPDADILLLLRNQGKDFRIGVRDAEFKKLSSRVNELNRHIALNTLERPRPGEEPMELILAEVCGVLEEQLKHYTDRMKDILDDAWKLRRAGLEVERERVVRAELDANTINTRSEEVQRLHSEISALAGREWGVWAKLLSGILRADRRLLPSELEAFNDWLERLDDIRAELAEVWRTGRDEASRARVARRLSGLASEMSK